MTALRAAIWQARQGLRTRRRRAVLTGLGIALAAAMLSAAVVVAYGLGTGFDRAATAADLPDVIVRFQQRNASDVIRRIEALPDIARYSLRFEAIPVGIRFGSHSSNAAVGEVLDTPGPGEGYAVVAGHNLSGSGRDVLVEKALASAWGIAVGDTVVAPGLGPERVVGLAQSPDDVGYPLADPRFYLTEGQIDARFGVDRDPSVNLAEIWLRNPAYLGEVLAQARATSFGLRNIRFETQGTLRLLIDQAAGIVVDLLVALSVIALVTAGVMLAASARAEVARRLGAIGVRRAVGSTRGHETLSIGIEGLLVSVPFATVGMIAGALVTLAPAGRLLQLINEPPPGGALADPLALAWIAAIAIPAAGAAWPAWRASSRSVVTLLRGADVAAVGRGRGRGRSAGREDRGRSVRLPGGGLVGLGARLVGARRARLAATAVSLGLSTAFVLLMLALASELNTLETDPGALGRHYQLTAVLPPSEISRVRAIPGVEAAAVRYEEQAADSFDLGEAIDVIAYPGDGARFESPPLVAGRRAHGPDEVDVGQGLSEALGLSPGTTLALALQDGNELRLRVAGVVSSLDYDGRVAYVPASALLADDPSAPSTIAVIVAPGASAGDVYESLIKLGGEPHYAAGATNRAATLIAVLRTIVTAIAIVDGLVCLYALVQACALMVAERRSTVAVLRACGAGVGAVSRLLVGAAVAIIVPAAIVGVLLERLVLGPALSNLAINYAVLPLSAGIREIAIVLIGLALAAVIAVAWVAREAARESVVAGLS